MYISLRLDLCAIAVARNASIVRVQPTMKPPGDPVMWAIWKQLHAGRFEGAQKMSSSPLSARQDLCSEVELQNSYPAMARGPRKHLKRVAAPSHWMLDKLTGVFAPRPSTGPHKLRECLPLALLLRNRLKYALTYDEVKLILMQRLIKVDGKVRTDKCYPAGFMDVISIEKTKENFRLLFDTKGRFVPHKIRSEEAAYKLCRVKKIMVGAKGIPTAVTHDARTIRFIDPKVKANDTLRIDINTGKVRRNFTLFSRGFYVEVVIVNEGDLVLDHIKFETGNLVMITGGHNVGRVGVIAHRDKHDGGFDIVHVRDEKKNSFATRLVNVFVIGAGHSSQVSLPKERGIRLTIMEDRQKKLEVSNHQ
ncbi:ribosomal protein RPS4 [Cardiosporidium cionae]|uniref:Ribosomal protein RPS4 n=1 Tax=Cardiosporidium cionae TaxID=476202 RepID=A0ABQ7JCF6_9APIC|nr:ribosomal protein RPS4 [Cardiosporidium cionae]|eukprot:KAF8821683.1 ribosomal protein RPS4 [Cardiosporidium cionae]